MTNKSWTKTSPEPPKGTRSDWYWFWKDGDVQPIVTEVWQGRCYWLDGWWGPRVVRPKDNPNKK